MIFQTLMNLYLHINLVLICALIVFVSIHQIFDRLKIQTGHAWMLRLSQSLLLISLLTPLILHFIPERTLPETQFSVFRAFPETLNFSSISESIQHPKKETSRTSPSVSKLKNTWLTTHLIFSFWSFGFILFFARKLRAFLALSQILNNSTRFKCIGAVRVMVSEKISIPFSARFYRRKWVILPLLILNEKLDLQLALKHELQHHRQGDTLWAVAIELLECLFYLNPSIYLWKILVVEQQEFSCDEALLGQKGVSARDYGSCLVRVAETALKNRQRVVGTTAMAAIFKNPMEIKSLLHRRIEMMMQDQKSSRKLAGSFMGTFTLFFTVAFAYGAEQSTRNQINAGTAQVDPAIQKIADQVLEDSLKSEGAEAGIAIVADPNNGAILAIANIDHKGGKKGHWALSERLEPASFMKGITAAEAIEMGVTTLDEKHNCENGVYHYGNHTYHDWKNEGWNQLSTADTIAKSSDICAMKIAEEIGDSRLSQMLLNYGFGPNGSGKTFPEARVGVLPDDNSKDLVPTTAYGMLLETTPLEIVQAYGAIANGGNLLAPVDASGASEKPSVVRRVMSEANSQKMRNILAQVVLYGTANKFPSKLYSMAGKTETSFSEGVMEGDSTGGWQKSNIAGFVGFAPVTHPRVEVFVQIFHPAATTGASGGTHAVPVFTALIDQILQHMEVTPDKQEM